MKNNTSVPPGGKDYFAPQTTKKKKKLKAQHYHWALKLVLLTLAISMALSFVSSKMLEKAGYLPAFLVLTLFVLLIKKMSFGLYVSAEGAHAQNYRLETIANNIANTRTGCQTFKD